MKKDNPKPKCVRTIPILQRCDIGLRERDARAREEREERRNYSPNGARFVNTSPMPPLFGLSLAYFPKYQSRGAD